MKYAELKNKTEKEMLEILFNLKREQMNLRFQKVAGEAVQGARINLVRKTVARIKTRLNNEK